MTDRDSPLVSDYQDPDRPLESRLNALRQLYSERRGRIRRRLQEFRSVPEREYVYELIYCLLTPQSKAEHAEAVVEELKRREFAIRPFDARSLLSKRSHYIRFHNTKARRLRRVLPVMPDIHAKLKDAADPIVRREAIAERVDGFGLKEATHFLRNIGKNGDCAILDRHILRNLKRVSVIQEVPRSLTKRVYLDIEGRFRSFAQKERMSVNELDLLFWSIETGEIRK